MDHNHDASGEQDATPNTESSSIGHELEAAGLQRYVDAFKANFPDFTSFDASDSEYRRSERAYKDRLVAAYRDYTLQFVQAIQRGEGHADQLGLAAIQLFSDDLATPEGKWGPQNLVPWQQYAPLKNLDMPELGAFGNALADLLDESKPIEIRIDSFVAELRQISESADIPMPRGHLHAYTTFFLFLHDPSRHIFIKTGVFERAMAALWGGYTLSKDDFIGDDYAETQRFARMIHAALAEQGWAPNDMIDVQSFLYVADTKLRDADTSAPWKDPTAVIQVQPKYRDYNPKQYQSKGWHQFQVLQQYDRHTVGELKEAGPRYYEEAPEFFQTRNWANNELKWSYQRGYIDLLTAHSTVETQHPGTDATGNEQMADVPLNQILYGPPGTGKTWQTARRAVAICDGQAPDRETEVRHRYQELVEQQRIRFVTFHQSFSYEEFVEGIRPVLQGEGPSADGQVQYRCAEGVFREIVALATATPHGIGEGFNISERRIYKVSLGNTADPEQEWVYRDCIDNGHIAVGFADEIDFTDTHDRTTILERIRETNLEESEQSRAVQPIHYLKNELMDGDIVVVSDGNHAFRAVGEVAGPYRYREERDSFRHTRPVNWIRTFEPSLPVGKILGKVFSQRTLYRIDAEAVNVTALNALLAPESETGAVRNYVLIIDEINRANISRVFGELITLLEPDKRSGASSETVVTLPYSGTPFAVPPNLYVIGTMNTADRSIALLDTALRRRFAFVEVGPDPTVLEGLSVDGVEMDRLLSIMNQRIEVLFDRDHRIGHAYFSHLLEDETADIDSLAAIFSQRIIPLLEEYFFEDWNRIRLVLGDNLKPRDLQFIQRAYGEAELTALFGTEDAALVADDTGAVIWHRNLAALRQPEAYRLIYEPSSEEPSI